MDNKKIIKELLNSGITQSSIAQGTGIAQSKLSRLSKGSIDIGNMTYDNVMKLVKYSNILDTLSTSDDLKFDELLKMNEDLFYGGDAINYDDESKQALVVTNTIDEYWDWLSNRFPNTSDHNQQIIGYWSEVMEQFMTGDEIISQLDDSEYSQTLQVYINKYGDETYYTIPFENDEDKLIFSVLNERDITDIINSFSSYQF